VSAPVPALVTTDEALARLAESWRSEPDVGLDTEFLFERTFWPIPGLVQVATSAGIWLVDAVAIRDLTPLAPLLASGDSAKILHAGSGDAVLFERVAGARPGPVFDTQVAAAFCGMGPSLSYGALVAALEGVELAKSETRTDWTRRPLTREQLTYAGEDVAHLLPVAERLRRRLEPLGRLRWVEEDSAAALAPDPERENPELAFRRLRGWERLPPPRQRVVRRLATWRELEARRLDLARPFVLRDETLLELARKPPATVEELRKAKGFETRRHERFAPAILEVVERALAERDDAVVELPRFVPKEAAAAVAEVVTRTAGELELPAELLLSRRGRDRLLAAGGAPLSSRLAGWRRELLGARLDALGIA
jgi:ribonuclease D